MRILFDARRAVARATGIGRVIDGLLRALAQDDGVNEYLVLHGERNPLGATAPANFVTRRIDVPFNSLAQTWAMPRLARAWTADVAYFPFWLAPPVMPCPFVVAVHDLLYSHYRSYLSLPRRWFHDGYTAMIVRAAARIHTLSEHGRADLQTFFKVPAGKIDIVSPDADQVYRPRVTGTVETQVLRAAGLTQPYFVYVGNQRPHKNLPRLLEAFRRVATSTATNLAIVGAKGTTADPYAQPLAASVGDLTAAGRVRFLGQIDDADLSVVLGAARALVYPTLHEGFGLPALEAMRCGTPVVCSSTTSLPEVVGDAALLIDPCSVDQIADGMIRIDGDEALRADLSRRGLERAALFSWQRSARTWLDSLTAAAESRR